VAARTATLLALCWSATCATGAADDAAIAAIRKALAPQRALAVHLGMDRADFALAFGGASNMVHGVEPDAATARRVSDDVAKAGLAGRVWVENGSLQVLPYVNGLANVAFADDWKRATAAGLTAAEFVRVIAPGGMGCVGQRADAAADADATEKALRQWLAPAFAGEPHALRDGGVWLLFRKPRPAEMDEWTHELHDSTRNPATADRLAAAPQQIHWIGGTPYTWQIEHYRTAGNRVALFYAGRRGLSRWATFKEDVERIEVLDAFNGVRLWKREYAAPAKGFYPIMVADRIVIQAGEALLALNAANGEPMLTYTNAVAPHAGVVLDRTLFCVRDGSVRALDLDSGARIWERVLDPPPVWEAGKQKSGYLTYNPVAAEGMLLLLEKVRGTNATAAADERVVGLDAKTGQEVWRYDDPAILGHQKRYFYHGGRLFFAVKAGFVGVPLAKDKAVWTLPVTPLDERRFAGGNNVFGIGDKLWVRQGASAGFMVGEKVDIKQPLPPKDWVAADLETGKVVRHIGYEPGISGWRGRCYADLAGPNFIYSENGEFVDLVANKLLNYRIYRGHCGWGPFFGNGFFYGTPTWCIFCYPALHGAIAASPRQPPATAVPEDQRLEKGPAYAEFASATPPVAPPSAPEDWPMYRHNARRTAGTPVAVSLPLADKPAWTHAFGERVSGAVIADGRVFAAVVNQGRVCALDAKTGQPVWSVAAGPRVDSPPTWHRGLLLFGSHDGFVYALRASDGALAWRFRAAPERRLMAVTDRVESAWPLPGATLIHDGTLYGLAGRITGADGGMPMFALDPMTGAMKWRRVVGRTTNPKLATGGDPKLYYWIEPEGQLSNNHLVGDGNVIRLPDQHFAWDFRASDGEQIVPDAVQGVRLSTFTSHFPWLGYDRPTWSYTFHGFDIHPEYRHPYESGTMMAYAGTNEVGIVCKRLRKEQVTELIPTRVDDAQKNWEDKTRGELPWKPLRLSTDVHALVIAGTDALIGGMDFALNPTKGRLIALSLKTGVESQRIELPALPTYDGVAVARGMVFVSLQDGTLLCFAGQR
jgi:outer membrane protein assembly factor BamB